LRICKSATAGGWRLLTGGGSPITATHVNRTRRDSWSSTRPFIAHYIERHPEYEALVASGYRGR